MRKVLIFFILIIYANCVCASTVIFLTENKTDRSNFLFEAFSDKIKQETEGLAIKTYKTPENTNEKKKLIKELYDNIPEVIVCLGDDATRFCHALMDFRFVFIQDTNKDKYVSSLDVEKRKNYTGILHKFSKQSFWKAVKKKFPEAERVGVLKTKNFIKQVKRAQKICKKEGLKLIARKVSFPWEVKNAFRDICKNKIDIFWFIQDRSFIEKWNEDYFFKSCEAKKIIFLTQNAEFFNKKNVLSITADYKLKGVEAANIVLDVLNDKKVEDIPILQFNKLKVNYNE